MKSLCIATALLAVGTMAAVAAEPVTNITIATEGAYEPWNFTAPDGSLDGLEVDLAKDLCARMEITCTIVAQDWDGLIPALQAKKFDAIMASLIITPKRLEVVDFSVPYAPTSGAFMVEKGSDLATLPGKGEVWELEDDPIAAKTTLAPLIKALDGKIVGVQNATAAARFLDAYFEGVAEPRIYKTTEQHDLDLRSGRIDAVLSQKSSLAALVLRPDYASMTLAGPTLVGGSFGHGVAVALRKGEDDLKARFNTAIAAAKADGTIDRLAMKWLKKKLE